MRRNIGKHFNYELGGGAGFAYILERDNFRSRATLGFNVHLRIGYRF
ncbi:MAG: hypothetical protein ACFB0B_09095 [Thermonemataceae bacterium]